MLIATYQTFLVLNNIQKANVADMVRQMSTSAEKAKSDLIIALNEISTKLGTESVSDEQEPVLEKFICEYDGFLIHSHERVAIFYDVIRDQLSLAGIYISTLLDIAITDASLPVSQINLNEQSFKGKFTNVSPSPEY